jgi:hypothetical protein
VPFGFEQRSNPAQHDAASSTCITSFWRGAIRLACAALMHAPIEGNASQHSGSSNAWHGRGVDHSYDARPAGLALHENRDRDYSKNAPSAPLRRNYLAAGEH